MEQRASHRRLAQELAAKDTENTQRDTEIGVTQLTIFPRTLSVSDGLDKTFGPSLTLRVRQLRFS